MKAASHPNLNRETTSFRNFSTLYQEVDNHHDMTLNERPNIGHGDDSEDSETSPFNDILSLSPLISSNKIGFSAAPRSVMMFRCESEHTTSSVGSNQFSCCDSGGARSEGTNPTQMEHVPSQSFSRSVAPGQTLDMPQAISTSLPQSHLNLILQRISGTNSQQNLISFSHPSQQPKQSDFPGHVSHTTHTPTSNQPAGAWAPAPPPSQFQRMRTYTEVYKRGSVGRSIDIARYSGYEELKQDLARIFGIEGQLEDRHSGWKLVYMDRFSYVLLVGNVPWEEFVNCVRFIKILSPQEFGNLKLPAAC